MQVDQVEHHLEANMMRLAHEGQQILVVAVFLVDAEKVLDAVGVLGVAELAGKLALAPVRLALVVVGLGHGAKVYDVNTQFSQVVEQPGGGLDRSLRRKGSQEQLIDDGPVQKFRRSARRLQHVIHFPCQMMVSQ